jgi:ABC-type enterochelin transport system ATPase subunit
VARRARGIRTHPAPAVSRSAHVNLVLRDVFDLDVRVEEVAGTRIGVYYR